MLPKTILVIVTSLFLLGCGNEYQRSQRVKATFANAPIAEIEKACLDGGENADFSCFEAGSAYNRPKANRSRPAHDRDLGKAIYFYGQSCERGRPYGCFNAGDIAYRKAVEERGGTAALAAPPPETTAYFRKACTTPRYGMDAVACNQANDQAVYWKVDMGAQKKAVTSKSPF